MKISLVTSAYKKQDVINTQLNRLYTFLTKKGYDFEIIVVIDGLIDDTKARVEKLIEDKGYDKIQLLYNVKNRGKGYSIRKGLKIADGDIIGYIDADTDIQIRTLKVGLERMLEGDVDAVTPSKFHKDSNVKVSFKRRILTKGFQMISRIFLPVPKGVDDVSCGLKLFKGYVAKDIVKYLHVNRFAIDSEVFYYLNRNDYNVEMIPFYVKISGGSTAANVKQIFIMLKDIVRLGIQTRLLALSDMGFKPADRMYTNLSKGFNL